MNNAPLHRRFSEASFRRFERTIWNALTSPYGETITPSSFGLSQTRCAQAIRDAMRSFHEHKWTSPIDHDSFLFWHEVVRVRELPNGSVFIGTAAQEAFDPAASTPTSFTPASPRFPWSDIAHLEALAWCADQGLLTNAVQIETNTIASSLEEKYNIAVVDNNDGTSMLK